MKKADAIFCADLHLREDVPLCRTDDYLLAQQSKLAFLFNLSVENGGAPIYCAGDLFHKSRTKKGFEYNLIVYEWPLFVGIPGNHDLPNHSLEAFEDSSLGILYASRCIKYIPIELEKMARVQVGERSVGLIHKLIHKDGDSAVKFESKTISTRALKLLRDNSDVDVIVSGDNHKTFVEEYEGRLLVNPGSMMRMTADQTDHKPCVFLYYAQENKVDSVYFPYEKGVVSREHIGKQQERDERINAFVSRMNEEYGVVGVSLSFRENVEKSLVMNKVASSVKKIIYECMEE